MFEIRRGHESRDSFVEPEVIPVAAGHEVTPPLMRKLVRRKPQFLFLLQHLLSVRFSQHRETAHLLFDTAGCQHLRVSSVGILNTGVIFEEVEHVRRVAKDATHFTRSVVGCEVLKLNVSPLFLYDVKRTGGKTEDVGRNSCWLPPLKQVFLAWQFALRNELAVSDWC